MPVQRPASSGVRRDRYDVVVVGTGFASSFFLHRFLARASGTARVLVLERGPVRSHADQLRAGRRALREASAGAVDNRNADKPWDFCIGFGGGSNCWTGNTPRMLPDDFRLRSAFGVGADWPFGYETLEPYYDEAERIMAIAGPTRTAFPRSRPYPQPPHLLSAMDEVLAAAFPGAFFPAPSARPTRATAARPPCCANGVCDLCPIDSKFRVPRELGGLFEDPRVTLRLGAAAQALETEGGAVATAVVAAEGGRETRYRGDAFVLGANAIFNAHILLRSGLGGPRVGRGLCEQVSRTVVLYLDGVDHFGGSTKVTGHGYMLHGPERRRAKAAALIETHNAPIGLRPEAGRWREIMPLRVICEDLPQPANRVELDGSAPERPVLRFDGGRSAYARRALDAIEADLSPLLSGLPVERLEVREENPTESHIQCTTPMSLDPAGGVVDADAILHGVRNVAVLGSGSFPTASPANPTLTICAVALRCGDLLARGGVA